MTEEPVRLSLANLSTIAPQVDVPAYRRDDLSAGIVHIGVGNFHRAHQAVYLDALMNRNLGRDFALIGAGVRPGDATMRAALNGQDWLTTVVELDPAGLSARVTGAMVDFVPVEPDTRALVEAIARPDIRIVSLTVTEGGYCVDSDGRFDPGHPDIVHDAANPNAPRSTFGVLLRALRARREAGVAPFAAMSCDNIPGNGHATRNAVAGLAELIDPALARWVRENVAFPNGMVDRITPATSDRERQALAETFGIVDAWPVFCEPFRQWVLEDDFPQGRPPLEEVGVTFTRDVEPYEVMKIRILNGGHAAIAYPAALLRLTYAHEAMAHPLVRGFFDKLEETEILPTVPVVPDIDLGAYKERVAERFANRAVGDTIARLVQDGSNRQPKFIVPTLRARIAASEGYSGLALEMALWCRYAAGEGEDGLRYRLDDPNGERVTAKARAARSDPKAFLDQPGVFGDVVDHEGFARTFADWLQLLWTEGTVATLERYLAD